MIDKHKKVKQNGEEGYNDEEDDRKSAIKSFPQFHFARICFQ